MFTRELKETLCKKRENTYAFNAFAKSMDPYQLAQTAQAEMVRNSSLSLTLYHTIPTFNDPEKEVV